MLRFVAAVACAAWLADATLAGASEADPDQRLVDNVPAEAAIVLIVKSGEDLREDVYEFVQNAGMPRDTVDWDEMNPLGLSEQFEGRRGLAFFRRPPESGKLGEGREHSKWVGLIPVANAGQALENLNAESIGNDLHAFSVRRRDVPDPLIGKERDDRTERDAQPPGPDGNRRPQRETPGTAQPDRVRLVAAVAQPDLLAVAREPAALRWFLANRQGPGLFSTWQSDRRQLFAEADVFFSLSVKAFRPAVLAKLEEDSADVRSAPPANDGAADDRPRDHQDTRQVSRTARAWTVIGPSLKQQIRTAVEQTESIYGGAAIEPQRIRGTLQLAFEPASRLYEELAAKPAESGNLLSGLPDRPFLIAGALNAKPLEPLITRLTEQVSEVVRSLVPQDEEAQRQIDQQVQIIRRMNRVEGLVDFTADGPFVLERSYFDDAEAVFKEVVTGLRENDALTRLFLPKNVALEHEEKRIGQLRVVEFRVREKDRPEAEPQQPDEDRPGGRHGAALLGGLLEELTIQAAVIDNSIVEAIGPQEEPIRLFLDGQDESLRDQRGLQTTLEALPDEEVFGILLLDPTRMAQAFAEGMARAFSQGEQREQQLQRVRQRFEAGESAPPIGISASTAGPGLSISAVVLADSLKPLTSIRLQGTAEDAEGARPPATPVEPE